MSIFRFRKRLRNYILRLIDSELKSIDRKLKQIGDELKLTDSEFKKETALQKERLNRFELVFTEHPYIASSSLRQDSFPSPAVSVIMPTWNRAPVIGAAIQSVIAQDFSDWELIVVDDGSTDDTATVLASFSNDSRVRYIRLPHAGQCKARNHAQSVARGSLIAYLDSDNLWYPAFLAGTVALFAARSDLDCAYGALVTDAHWGRILFEPFNRERLIAGNYIAISTFVHRRSMIDRFGGFDEELSCLEDWDLILRYTAHASAYALPIPAARYRVVDDKRVTVTQSLEAGFERIRRKWA